MLDIYSDTESYRYDDTTRDFRTIYGVANNYLFNCIIDFLNARKFVIIDQFPGFVKFMYNTERGTARCPSYGIVLRDYSAFKHEMYTFIKEVYDESLYKESADTVFETSHYYKLYRQYFDKYEVAQVKPTHKDGTFCPIIDYHFEIRDRETQELLKKDKYGVKHFIPEFDSHSYYFCLLLLDAFKKGTISL